MDKKEMIALAERIACKHRKFSADEVADRCMAIMHAVDTMTGSPSIVLNPGTSYRIESYGAGGAGGVLTDMPPIGPDTSWRMDAKDLAKNWREDEVVEISAGMADIRWRGTIQEARAGKFPHSSQGINKWRFLKVEAYWLPGIGHNTRPPSWAGSDDSSVLCHYRLPGDGGKETYRVERLGDVDWRTVLAVKRVLE